MNPKESGIAASFEEQFANREKFGEREINVLDISPPNPIHTVLFIPGWKAPVDEYRKTIKRLYNSGAHIVAPELVGQEEQKAKDIRLLAINKGLRRIDVAAHSVGVISAAKALRNNPSLAERLILINSASLLGDDDNRELIKRYKSLLAGRVNGGPRKGGVQEVKDMAEVINEFNMYDHLKELTGLGVNIQILHSRDDTLFPYDRVIKEAKEHGWNISEISGNHLSLDGVDFKKLGY